MLVKTFCEAFKSSRKKPALILKTSSAGFSVMDKNDMLNRIRSIRGNNKTYPNEYMVKVLDFIVSKTKSQILFNYIPNQKNQALSVYKKTKKNTQAHIFLDIYAKNLRDFIALTSQCNTLIGNEGGAVNMAKAINIPTFTFFSPWIRKTSWNTATDNKTHIAVHLKDYKPEIYEANNLKTIKSKVEHFYNLFEFDYFKDQLEVYLDHIIE